MRATHISQMTTNDDPDYDTHTKRDGGEELTCEPNNAGNGDRLVSDVCSGAHDSWT